MVKKQYLENSIEIFRGSEVKITTERKKNIYEQQLEVKILIVKSLVDKWIDQQKFNKLQSLNCNQLIQSLLVDFEGKHTIK